MQRVKVAVLVSGGGTNLQALIDASKAGQMPSCDLALVVASKPHAYALERAKAASIKTAVVVRKTFCDKQSFEDALISVLEENKIDFIVLAGFLYVLSEAFVVRYKDRIINVHPSLIPSFCGDGFYGLRVHQAALDYGVRVTGATVHYVNEQTDGGKIILQKAVDIYIDDTAETLQQRVMRDAEWVLLPKACEMIAKIILQQEKDKADGN